MTAIASSQSAPDHHMLWKRILFKISVRHLASVVTLAPATTAPDSPPPRRLRCHRLRSLQEQVIPDHGLRPPTDDRFHFYDGLSDWVSLSIKGTNDFF
jgi:hypothetical protein